MKASNDTELVDKNGTPVKGRPAQYANIDENGNVLFLDQERMNAHAQPEKPVFVPHAHGWGIKDAFWSRFSVRPWNFNGYAAAFHVLSGKLKWVENPRSLGSKALRTALMMPKPGEGYTGGTVYNLNVDIEDEGKSVVVPMDLVKAAISKAHYIGAMDKCICRTANKCEKVPSDVACMFLDIGGEVVVDHGIAHEITKDEAYAKVDRAASLGLMCQALWVQIEQLVWGIKNQQMSGMVELCFCCPCCCVALNLCRHAPEDIRRRFTPAGFTAVVNPDRCIGCKQCADPYCPQDAIHFRKDNSKMVVDQDHCMGCGYCKNRCPNDAIAIKQTMPMRESLHDYFLSDARLDIAVDGYPGN